MSVRLNGSTSGYTELDAPAVAGNNTLKLPTGNGSAGQSMTTDGSGNLSFGSSIVSGTSQASTSGTSIDFTGIPSWAKRVTVMFRSLSTNGTSIIQIQLGTTSGFVTSGYLGSVDSSSTGVSAATFATGLAVARSGGSGAANVFNGHASFVAMGSNFWTGTQLSGTSNSGQMNYSGCSVDLSGTLDRVRITTVNGTDTFDAGTINLLWE